MASHGWHAKRAFSPSAAVSRSPRGRCEARPNSGSASHRIHDCGRRRDHPWIRWLDAPPLGGQPRGAASGSGGKRDTSAGNPNAGLWLGEWRSPPSAAAAPPSRQPHARQTKKKNPAEVHGRSASGHGAQRKIPSWSRPPRREATPRPAPDPTRESQR